MDADKIIWLQRQREADPKADERARRIVARMESRLDKEKLRKAMQAARKADNTKNAVKHLRQMADMVSRAFAPDVPCKEGCNHCCHIPTLITLQEAMVIATEIRRPIKTNLRYSMKANEGYTGVACPFLKEGRCSIYRYRPITCRMHVALDIDNLLCNLASPTRQPQWNSMDFHMTELMALGGDEGNMPQMADVRDFFGEQQK